MRKKIVLTTIIMVLGFLLINAEGNQKGVRDSMKTDNELEKSQAGKTGIQMAILRKTKLKIMALQHDFKNDGELYANVPWEEMNSFPSMISGTRGYMFADPALAKDGKDFYTIGIEVPITNTKLIEGCFVRDVPASVYAVLFREPGTNHDVFGAAKNWSNDKWHRNTEITAWSFDDNKDEGFFVFIPIASNDVKEKTTNIPEIPTDSRECYKFIKKHSQPIATE